MRQLQPLQQVWADAHSPRVRPRRPHPRRCGADKRPGILTLIVSGSSLQVRGRLTVTASAAHLDGLIPAGAGQTGVEAYGYWLAGAHPRRCGADTGQARPHSSQPGSSPQVRGRRHCAVRVHLQRGLIPAGADLAAGVSVRGRQGSSPRVRGRLNDDVVLTEDGGLIPAGAGQTPSLRPSWPMTGAHPRGCGADSPIWYLSLAAPGSSPQVRGRRDGPHQRRDGLRLIPAGAGQTIRRVDARPRTRAHPRGCGADFAESMNAEVLKGSSPRVRGRRPGGG